MGFEIIYFDALLSDLVCFYKTPGEATADQNAICMRGWTQHKTQRSSSVRSCMLFVFQSDLSITLIGISMV